MHLFYDYTETIGYAFLSVHDRTALSWLVSDCYGTTCWVWPTRD